MDVFIESCERAYQFTFKKKHTEYEEFSKIGQFKFHE